MKRSGRQISAPLDVLFAPVRRAFVTVMVAMTLSALELNRAPGPQKAHPVVISMVPEPLYPPRGRQPRPRPRGAHGSRSAV